MKNIFCAPLLCLSILACSVPALAQDASDGMIEIAVTNSGNLPFVRDFKVRIKENTPTDITLENETAKIKLRYTFRAQKTPETILSALPVQLQEPISIEVKIEQAAAGQAWVVQGKYSMVIEENSTGSIHSGNKEHSHHIQLTPRRISAAEQQAISAKASS